MKIFGFGSGSEEELKRKAAKTIAEGHSRGKDVAHLQKVYQNALNDRSGRDHSTRLLRALLKLRD
jgi:hypothetical protein